MSERHSREQFFMATSGEVRQPADAAQAEMDTSKMFRFSELVSRKAPLNSDALLSALAVIMTKTMPDVDSHIPAGFTYLGQFVDHDLTMDASKTPLDDVIENTSELLQGRSPALDLDSLYGRGPERDPVFYQKDGKRLKVGVAESSSLGNLQSDLPGFDLPRSEVGIAKIPDERNDENLAVAQTHLAFIRFHNSVCDRLEASDVLDTFSFAQIRDTVTKHYQWMLIKDYLPRIVEPAIVDDVFMNGRRVFEVNSEDFPTMPLEFSVAAFRFGHSMIRELYNWNGVFGLGGPRPEFGTLMQLFRFSGKSSTPSDKFVRLPTNWIADWTRLYDFAADGFEDLKSVTGVNMARPIDTQLTDPLALLPLGSFADRNADEPERKLDFNLAFRNLKRGNVVQLASGQEVAEFMSKHVPDFVSIDDNALLSPAAMMLDETLKTELTNNTPLWYYILREAELNTDGQFGAGRLGAVGGRIVAEVFHRAIESSRCSILSDHGFIPHLGEQLGVFRMTDLLKHAYDASAGELRPVNALKKG